MKKGFEGPGGNLGRNEKIIYFIVRKQNPNTVTPHNRTIEVLLFPIIKYTLGIKTLKTIFMTIVLFTNTICTVE